MYRAPEHYLNTDANTGRLMAHARLLTKLSGRFHEIAPGGLREAAHVANYRAGTLIIHAENGAVAAKLRQLSRRLCDRLSFEGCECNEIEVKVQPKQLPFRSMTSTLKPLSGKTAGILRSTVEALPKGPLRHALDTLLQRSARSE
ncbi:MAG: DUF721 domain-containing protein [Azonexaceae bacterium]|uniref:DciA family protein n=1 Tax=Azonexus sp. R2A61 TaxID=2744443 RepID=UPI001F42CE5B|nr:DciA family protein [Azonexus sp. R2A61]MCE1238768.1 DUF721 domain-containing protein [Azonexaceae bacterium]